MASISKALIIFTLLAVMIEADRLDYQSTECRKYEGKLRALTTLDIDQKEGYSFPFSGDITFIGTTSDVQINIRYSDQTYFNDPNYWGLVQEDGKTPETTCLDFKLLKFADSNCNNGTQVTDLIITPSNNTQKLWRYYSFTIKETDFPTRLIQSENSNQYIYRGYYGIAFNYARTYKRRFTFYFYFSVTIDKPTGAPIDNYFRSMSEQDFRYTKFESILNWCSDFNCSNYITTPDLHFNDQFVVQQVITSPGLQGYYLGPTEVWYIGFGLNKKASIQQIDFSTPGQANILLKAEIVWENVTIIIHSEFSYGGRLLSYTSFNNILTSTGEINCIKAENFESCPDCEQQCDANGYASHRCAACVSSGSAILYGLVLVFLF